MSRDFPSPAAITRLQSAGVRLVVLHEAGWDAAEYTRTAARLSTHPLFIPRATFGTPGAAVRVFELRRAPP